MKRYPSPKPRFLGIPASLVIAGALTLSACGGGGSGDGGGGSGDGSGDGGGSLSAGTGSLTIAVTDKPPMPEIIEVNVVFTGITLKPQDGEAISFNCGTSEFACGSDGTRTIDLRALIGDTREIVLDAADVPAGIYEWIRLHVDAATPAKGSTGASNVVFETNPGGNEPLVIPSGQQTGLKLVSGFEVPAGGEASFTIDFDLRRGLVRTGNGRVMLKPAHRLVDNGGVGVLRGEVSPDFVVVDSPEVRVNGDPACEGPAAYVYPDGDTVPGQVGSEDEEPPVVNTDLEPVMMGGPTSNYSYEIGFLEAGDYRVAIACAANDGELPEDDNILISPTEPATIIAGEATRLDFLPVGP